MLMHNVVGFWEIASPADRSSGSTVTIRNLMPRYFAKPLLRAATAPVLSILLAFLFLLPVPAGGMSAAESLDDCGAAEVNLYLALARASEMAYDDSQPGLEETPSGCVALVREEADGSLIIAFRGSMLRDRNPEHAFSDLGGANVRRAYRDWVATNLKQTAGFLPRQYVEAAAVVEAHVREHPVDKPVYVTGHSKGGGAATYAFIAAGISPNVPGKKVLRMRCVTFNAAVVKEQNWRRLFRRPKGETPVPETKLSAGSVHALVMADDPVSRIAASEERRYVKRIVIAPSPGLTPNEQHTIRAVINELEKRMEPGH